MFRRKKKHLNGWMKRHKDKKWIELIRNLSAQEKNPNDCKVMIQRSSMMSSKRTKLQKRRSWGLFPNIIIQVPSWYAFA